MNRIGASGTLWIFKGYGRDVDGNKVVIAVSDKGYPTEFPWYEWLTMTPEKETKCQN